MKKGKRPHLRDIDSTNWQVSHTNGLTFRFWTQIPLENCVAHLSYIYPEFRIIRLPWGFFGFDQDKLRAEEILKQRLYPPHHRGSPPPPRPGLE
jgi:hypothetical protein